MTPYFAAFGVDIGNLLSAALAIVAIATLAGLGLTRGQVTTLRESVTDARGDTAALRQRLTDEREEREREKAKEAQDRIRTEANHKLERTQLEAKLEGLASDLDTLRRTVTGEAHLVAIIDHLDEHHAEARVAWERDRASTTALLDAINSNTAAVLAAVTHDDEGV